MLVVADLKQSLPLAIRLGQKSDLSFVWSSWLKSYRQSPANAHVDARRYYAGQKELINDLFTRSQVYIACNAADVDQIFGYIVAEPRREALVIHWLYVKHLFRKMGIAKRLLTLMLDTSPHDIAFVCSHIPGKGSDSFYEYCHHKHNITYDPSTKYGNRNN